MSVSEQQIEQGSVSLEPDVASPCIKACKINAETGLCNGCARTLDEIIAWSKASNATKLEIWALVEERRHSKN